MQSLLRASINARYAALQAKKLMIPNLRRLSAIASQHYRVLQVPIFSDNYAHVLVDVPTNTVATVDPADPDAIIDVLKKELKSDKLDSVLVTHKVRKFRQIYICTSAKLI